jgi:hypothetical protein
MYSYTFHIMKYYSPDILQHGHLVGSRLGGTHDLISVRNLSSHGFACTSSQAMSHATQEHLAWHDLRQTSIRKDSVLIQLRRIKVFKCLVTRAQALFHASTTLRTDHAWENPWLHKLSKVSIRVDKGLECSTNSAHDAHSLEH